MRTSRVPVLAVVLPAGLAVIPLPAAPAGTPGSPQGTMVVTVPRAPPDILNNGVVLTMVQVETRIVVGCSFTSVSPPGASRGAQAMFRNYLLPFDATTGQVDPVILPALDGVGPPTYAGA